MKLTQKTLTDAAKLASLAAGPKSTMPALHTLCLSADAGSLTVRATDLTTFATVTVPCEGSLAPTTVHVKAFLAAVAACATKAKGRAPSPEIAVERTEMGLRLTGSAGINVPFSSHPIDLPAYPTLTAMKVEYPTERLASALDFILPSVSCDETRFHLNGVHFADDQIEATDGHRMHRERNLPDIGAGEGFIVPRSSLVVLRKALNLVDGEKVSFGVGKGYAAFTVGNVLLAAKLIDVHFPPIEQVIPKHDLINGLTCDATALRTAVESAGKVNTSRTAVVVLLASPTRVMVHFSNPDDGTFNHAIEGSSVGPQFFSAFNGSYLVEALSGFSGSVTIQKQPDTSLGGDSWKAIKLESEDRLAVIMPLRVDESLPHLARQAGMTELSDPYDGAEAVARFIYRAAHYRDPDDAETLRDTA